MSDYSKIHFSPEQRAAIQALAAAEGVPFSTFVRQSTLIRVAMKRQQNAIASSPLRPESPDAA